VPRLAARGRQTQTSKLDWKNGHSSWSKPDWWNLNENTRSYLSSPVHY